MTSSPFVNSANRSSTLPLISSNRRQLCAYAGTPTRIRRCHRTCLPERILPMALCSTTCWDRTHRARSRSRFSMERITSCGSIRAAIRSGSRSTSGHSTLLGPAAPASFKRARFTSLSVGYALYAAAVETRRVSDDSGLRGYGANIRLALGHAGAIHRSTNGRRTDLHTIAGG